MNILFYFERLTFIMNFYFNRTELETKKYVNGLEKLL